MLLCLSLAHCSPSQPTTNPVKSIDLTAFDGIISDESFKGLVVIMASWCPPCREELPILSKLYEQYKDRGIQIVALSVDAEGPKAVQPLINELQVPFPVYWGGTPAVKRYRIAGVPTMMVFNNGKMVERRPGSHSRKAIEKKIKGLLSEAG